MAALKKTGAISFVLLAALVITSVSAHSKVKVYPIPFVPYGADIKQGAFGTDHENDIFPGRYTDNRREGLRFRNLPGDSGTITLYSSTGQEVFVENYSVNNADLFTHAKRADMLPSGVYIWVVRPSGAAPSEKGKLIILK